MRGVEKHKKKYEELAKEMERKGIRYEKAGRTIGVTKRTLWNKLHGIGDFTITEAIILRDEFFREMPLEVLFSKK